MSSRIGLIEFIDPEEVKTRVHDHVGLFVPDQSLPLRDIIQKFALTGDSSTLEDLVNRGFVGDEEFDDNGYTDLASMDIAEVEELYHRSQKFLADYEAALNRPVKSEPKSKPVEEESADA